MHVYLNSPKRPPIHYTLLYAVPQRRHARYYAFEFTVVVSVSVAVGIRNSLSENAP